MSEAMKSVVIGMYRQGNKFEIIAGVLGLNVLDVQLVVQNYFSIHK